MTLAAFTFAAAGLMVLLARGAGRVDPGTGLPTGEMGADAAIARARADSMRLPYT
jgi:hypothetical protein